MYILRDEGTRAIDRLFIIRVVIGNFVSGWRDAGETAGLTPSVVEAACFQKECFHESSTLDVGCRMLYVECECVLDRVCDLC